MTQLHMHAWEAQLSLVHVHVPMFRPVWWLQADNRSSRTLARYNVAGSDWLYISGTVEERSEKKTSNTSSSWLHVEADAYNA